MQFTCSIAYLVCLDDCLYDGYVKAPRAPLALSINQESRREALPVYVPLLTKWNDETRLVAMIAPEIDTLVVTNGAFPGAPHFGRLAKENKAVNKRIAYVSTWGGSLEDLDKEIDWKIELMGRLEDKVGRLKGFPWQNPSLSFGRIKVWTVIVDGDQNLGKERWEALLMKYGSWFVAVQDFVGEEIFRAPKLLRVVAEAEKCLAFVQGGKAMSNANL